MSKAQERREQEAELLAFLEERAGDERDRGEVARARSVTVAMARETIFREEFEKIATKVFKGLPVPKPYHSKKKAPTERVLNIFESDLHFGSLLDPLELPMRYTFEEEARRLAGITAQVIDYKRQYRDETKLHLHLVGDIIQNQLHDARDGAPLAEQANDAIWLLDQQIGRFSMEFNEVEVFTNPGNHGRNTARHRDRATNQKWDAIESIIYGALMTAAQRHPNVKVNLTRKPYYVAEAFDKRGFYTHGDTVLNPGNPNKSINIESVVNQTNKLNAGAAREGEREYDLFFVGHVHIGTLSFLPNGAVFGTNGPLIPTDGYGVSNGNLTSRCGQWMWESVRGHVVGDSRFAEVDKSTDADKSLEKLIRPFPGYGK